MYDKCHNGFVLMRFRIISPVHNVICMWPMLHLATDVKCLLIADDNKHHRGVRAVDIINIGQFDLSVHMLACLLAHFMF